ncbi:MAG: hypothetical protein ACOCZE_10600 [Planctomycetota bacterium]
MKRTINSLRIAALLMSTALAGTAWATTSTISAYFLGLDSQGAQRVTVQLDGQTHYTWSGEGSFYSDVRSVGDDGTADQLASIDAAFSGYCIEFSQAIHLGSYSTWQLESPQAGAEGQIDQLKARQIAYLLESFADSGETAELQLAIWEVLEETDVTLDLAGGRFSLRDFDGINQSLLSSWLADLAEANLDHFSVAGYFALTNSDVQDFLVYAPPVYSPDLPAPRQVVIEPAMMPEPITLVGGMLGLGAVGRYLRRRRTA